MLSDPESGMKTTHFTFLLYRYLFSWWCSEVQNLASRRFILHFTFLASYLGVLWVLDLSLKTVHFIFLPFYLFGVVWGPESCLNMANFTLPFYLSTWDLGCSRVQIQVSRWLISPFHLNFYLHRGALRSRFGSRDGSFYFSPFYLRVLWGPDLALKTAHFTFLPFYLGYSEFLIQVSRRLILPFYIFF